MDIDPESSFKNIFIQLLSLGFSFLDDAILLGLSQLGVHCASLEWLSKILLIGTLLYSTRGIWSGQYWSKKKLEFLDN